PTPGISRTPMRAVSSGECGRVGARVPGASSSAPSLPPFPADSVDRLVKQLSEAFGAEVAPPEPVPPVAACPAEEPARRSPPPPGAPEAERPPRAAGPGFCSGECSVRGHTPRPCCDTMMSFLLSLGSKPVRHKTNNKIMATSGGTGRSPLSILQDDNSPSAPAPRQGKRHVLGENLGEKKEVTADLSRSLKSGNCAWSDLNKENQRCPLVEN
ncbi:CDCA3 protein, partial [Podargus strigoides]|nr:CDCA3 protein [Podargus strigoides]